MHQHLENINENIRKANSFIILFTFQTWHLAILVSVQFFQLLIHMIGLALKKKHVKQITIDNQIRNVVKIHVVFQNVTEQHPVLWKLQVKGTSFLASDQ